MTQKQAAITLIAMVAHEVNRAYCQAIGDNSQKPWDDAPEWQRKSAESGVTAQLLNPSMTPEQRHNAWLDHKQADGWKYGEIKDEAKKTHPCMIPFGQLSKDQQVKDHLFGAVVSSLAPEFAAALASEEVVEETPAPADLASMENGKQQEDLGPGVFVEENASQAVEETPAPVVEEPPVTESEVDKEPGQSAAADQVQVNADAQSDSLSETI